MLPTIVIDPISHWTLNATIIIDFFFPFFYACFHNVWRCVFHFQDFAINMNIFVGQQEICLIMVFFATCNMAFILEVDDNMGHTFIHVNPFSWIYVIC
jgi:hypothetical protein